MSRKLAVVFPGAGYTKDKPLLYYAGRILKKYGYDVVSVNYGDLSTESIFGRKNNGADGADAGSSPDNKLQRDRVISFVGKAIDLVKKQLEDVDYTKCEQLIFVSKSIGSMVSAAYAKQAGIDPYQIFITPLEYAFQFMESSKASAFCGSSDPIANYEVISKLCAERGIAFHSYAGCNHSLETGDIYADIENLKRFAAAVDAVVSDMGKSIYDFSVLDRKQQPVDLSEYKGKTLLIVNTATGCGFTPQYQGLEQIYGKYKDKGFEILDFPCNQFNNQAPGTEEEIYSFCTSRYNISFRQFAKILVNGEKQSELYGFLKARKGFAGFDMSVPDSKYLVHKLEKEVPDYMQTSDIKWNFTKFLINRHGQVIERFEPTTDLAKVEAAIAKVV